MRMRELELLFIKYCRENQHEKVQACLTLAEDTKLDINAVDYEYDSAITAAENAAVMGHTEVIRSLAATGLVDWNKTDRYGCTPLYRALFSGHSDVVGIIVNQDLNFSIQDVDGETVAMAAVLSANARSVEILAEEEKCDCWNIPDHSGDTPLMAAIKRNFVNILMILLNCPRVNPNIPDRHGDSPVMTAIKEKNTILARMLIKCPRVDLRVKDKNGSSLQRVTRYEELQ